MVVVAACTHIAFLSSHTTGEKEFQEYFYLHSANNRSLVVSFAGTIRVLILPYPFFFLVLCFRVKNIMVFDAASDQTIIGRPWLDSLSSLYYFLYVCMSAEAPLR